MGNTTCCYPLSDAGSTTDHHQLKFTSQQHQNQLINVSTNLTSNQENQSNVPRTYKEYKKSHSLIPELDQYVRQTLKNHQFIDQQIENCERVIRQCGSDIYVGYIDEISHKPKGNGKMYKEDGSLFLGEFRNGKAEGQGVFIFSNGSYFLGEFRNNMANCSHGYYQSPQFKYCGQVKDNIFQGQGKQEGIGYTYQGKYVNGKRSQGRLIWTDQNDFTYFYAGTFNEEQKFHGKGKVQFIKGILAETKGIYEGEFVNGVKEGKGYYKNVSGMKYRGDYKAGKKEGFGIIYNNDDTIAYKGQMLNNLPHGKGVAFKGYKEIQAEWIEGIHKSMVLRAQNNS